jgi:hypothetical protein
LGDTQEKVASTYGKAPRQLALTEGAVWLYPEASLYFRITSQGKVGAWGVYRKND